MATAKTDWKSETSETMHTAADKAREFGAAASDKAKDIGGHAADKAKDIGGQIAEKAKEVGSAVADKAKEFGSAATEKAGQAASYMGKKTDQATCAVGGGMESLAGSIREHGPSEGILGSATSTVAKSLEETGHYIKEHGFGNLGEDLSNLIRRNPVPALLAGVAAGYLIARASRR